VTTRNIGDGLRECRALTKLPMTTLSRSRRVVPMHLRLRRIPKGCRRKVEGDAAWRETMDRCGLIRTVGTLWSSRRRSGSFGALRNFKVNRSATRNDRTRRGSEEKERGRGRGRASFGEGRNRARERENAIDLCMVREITNEGFPRGIYRVRFALAASKIKRVA